jgi:hypothetical protein
MSDLCVSSPGRTPLGTEVTGWQIVCRSGHVGCLTGTVDDLPFHAEDLSVVGHIQICALCGGRADWRRTRPPITKIGTSDHLNPNQR